MGILRAEHVPLLVHSPDDQATDPRGSELLRERAGARYVTCEGMYHNLLSEPGRARVHAEVVRFFSARAALGRAAVRAVAQWSPTSVCTAQHIIFDRAPPKARTASL